jgi:hypothetical protein
MINLNSIKMRLAMIVLLPAAFCLSIISCTNTATRASGEPHLSHNIVYYHDGHFAGWPANGGMWIWDNEVLVCFTLADHMEKTGHTYDNSTARNMFARSVDGGETWTLENAFDQGITGGAHDSRLGERARAPRPLEEAIDFTHQDFALLFQNESIHRGPAHFYYTYNRGRSWNGPFSFPNLDTRGFAARTDYIINGRNEMLVFLTAAKSNDREGRIACVRTTDGGKTWERTAWIGPEPSGFAIMPSSVRMQNSEILTTIRHREEGQTWLTSYFSNDNGINWQQLVDPVRDNVNSPPALIKLPDGRLVLSYVFRRSGADNDGSSVCARISSDNGRTWSEEIVLREKEGANTDVGYPRIVQRPDGRLVITYYWNNSQQEGKPPYRYIAATIWDPGK